MTNSFATRLLTWFDQHGRKGLPWQQEVTPYRVWVSEIMLQQTQVSTVIPYYQRFMQQFPTVAQLADAPQDEVLHLWTGLGYYARARNLHKAARQIMNRAGGQFPSTPDELQNLPGIGRSTAGAICAIAFNKRAPILDGNVKRVLARYHAIEGWPGKTSVSHLLWEKAQQHTPEERIADYTQAIMDIGATLCTRSKPDCERCPFNSDCKALANGQPTDFPGKKPRKTLPVKETLLLVMRSTDGSVLLEQRPDNGIWGGLWSFPECSAEPDISQVCQRYGCKAESWSVMPQQRHTFSHYHLDYRPVLVDVEKQQQVSSQTGIIWQHPSEPLSLGTAAPIKQLLANLGTIA